MPNPLIATSITVDDRALVQWESAADRTPALVKKAFRRQFTRLAQDVRKRLAAYPAAPKRPIRWKSERQRKAYFATDGFGHGIPYRRSGTLGRGWQTKVYDLADGGGLDILNDVPYMPFVQGSDTQPFHRDTGWTQIRDVMPEFQRRADDGLEQMLLTVSDEFAGVR